jgi:hypothetical protein
MKVELLLNDCNGQVSFLSESVAETRSNFKPDNMTHVSHEDTTCATFHYVIKETIRTHLTRVHIFHVIPRWASVGDQELSRYTSLQV